MLRSYKNVNCLKNFNPARQCCVILRIDQQARVTESQRCLTQPDGSEASLSQPHRQSAKTKYSMPITLMPSCQHPSCQHAKTYLMPQCQTHAKKMPKPNNNFFHAKTLYANIHHVIMSTPFMPTCQNLISR